MCRPVEFKLKMRNRYEKSSLTLSDMCGAVGYQFVHMVYPSIPDLL